MILSFDTLVYTDGTLLEVIKATREDIVRWINEAPNNLERSQRKQQMHGLMYSAGPTKLPIMLNQNQELRLWEGA